MLIEYNGVGGIICQDGGNYIAANMDSDKPGFIIYIHPTDPNLKYLNKIGKPRSMTRSQQRYQDYLSHTDFFESFRDYLGFLGQFKAKDFNQAYNAMQG